MNRIAALSLTAALLIAPSVAWATFDVTGKIRSIDLRSHEFQLANGQYYVVNRHVDLRQYKVGDTVDVTVHAYNDNQGLLNYVDSMTKAK